MSSTFRKFGPLLGSVVLAAGAGTVTAQPVSAQVIGPIPSDCYVSEYSTYSTSICSQRAHRAAVQCTDGGWHYGDWQGAHQMSFAFCPYRYWEMNASIDLPD